MAETYDAVIIGAGIAGLAIGETLLRKGFGRVGIIEKESMPATGSTGRSAGGIRQQFGDEVKIRAARLGFETYESFEDRYEVDPCFRKHGYLLLCTEKDALRRFEQDVELQRKLGLETQLLMPDEVARMIPPLNTEDLAAASFNGSDGYLDPHAVVQGYHSAFRSRGGEVRCLEKAVALVVEATRVKGVVLDGKTIHAGLTVVAAGPQAGGILASAGITLPLRTCKRQIFSTGPVEGIESHWPLIIDAAAPFYFRPEGEGVIMSLAEVQEIPPPDEGNEIPLARDCLPKLACVASHRCPLLSEARITGGWAGLRTLTPDERPVLGPVHPFEGLLVAVGFSGHGITLAPFAAAFIAAEAEGRPLEEEMREQFLASRFTG